MLINELDVELGVRDYREEKAGSNLNTLAGIHNPLLASELDVELGILDYREEGLALAWIC